MANLKVPVTLEDHVDGDAGAPVVLVEYGDYECPHCAHAYPIVKRLQEHFGERLAFVFRNFPLKEIHPHAEMAAESAEFAATQDKFWEMHDGIFEVQPNLSKPVLLKLADTLDLSSRDLDAALTSQQFAERVKSEFLGGVRSGVNGTPTFFVNGARHNGSFEFEGLAAAIEYQLSSG